MYSIIDAIGKFGGRFLVQRYVFLPISARNASFLDIIKHGYLIVRSAG
jgi:hypothetical protein